MSVDIKSTLPRRMKFLRERLGLNQSQLADRMGTVPSLVSHFEQGVRMPNVLNLVKIAEALDTSTDFLLGVVDSSNVSKKSDEIKDKISKLSPHNKQEALLFIEFLQSKEP